MRGDFLVFPEFVGARYAYEHYGKRKEKNKREIGLMIFLVRPRPGASPQSVASDATTKARATKGQRQEQSEEVGTW